MSAHTYSDGQSSSLPAGASTTPTPVPDVDETDRIAQASLYSRDPSASREAAGLSTHADGHTAGMGMVVLAAVPIGNMGDASTRLIHFLATADIVAAEDTRRLYDLANRLGVKVSGRVIAYHDHNERYKADSLIDEVQRGKTVLVVSDAGMPTINDPGHAIVERAIARKAPITCAPGPSAVLDALALSGLPTDRFCYEGFVPRRRSECLAYLRRLRSEQRTIVLYETPQRISETMERLSEVFPADRPMALCRELTKDHEEIRRSTIAGITQSVREDPPRGELVLVLQGASDAELLAHPSQATQKLSADDMARLAVQQADEKGIRMKEAIAQVVQDNPLPDGSLMSKKDVYARVLALESRGRDLR
jgi:16S rRNA (cytidine1402-2'-O)-methyltransferase